MNYLSRKEMNNKFYKALGPTRVIKLMEFPRQFSLITNIDCKILDGLTRLDPKCCDLSFPSHS